MSVNPELRKQFQFHKGTIRTMNGGNAESAATYFNSIKVQLEHSKLTNTSAISLFQFHKGTIRTPLR